MAVACSCTEVFSSRPLYRFGTTLSSTSGYSLCSSASRSILHLPVHLPLQQRVLVGTATQVLVLAVFHSSYLRSKPMSAMQCYALHYSSEVAAHSYELLALLHAADPIRLRLRPIGLYAYAVYFNAARGWRLLVSTRRRWVYLRVSATAASHWSCRQLTAFLFVAAYASVGPASITSRLWQLAHMLPCCALPSFTPATPTPSATPSGVLSR